MTAWKGVQRDRDKQRTNAEASGMLLDHKAEPPKTFCFVHVKTVKHSGELLPGRQVATRQCAGEQSHNQALSCSVDFIVCNVATIGCNGATSLHDRCRTGDTLRSAENAMLVLDCQHMYRDTNVNCGVIRVQAFLSVRKTLCFVCCSFHVRQSGRKVSMALT